MQEKIVTYYNYLLFLQRDMRIMIDNYINNTMATQVEFLDQLRVRVETEKGDVYILGYTDNMNYQIEQRFNSFYSKCVASLFDKYYDGNERTIWGPILAGMFRSNISPFMWVMMDKDKERARIGNRIIELRKEQKMDAKELAQKVGIDPGNLSRIEKGHFSVGIDILNKIASVLNMKLDFVPIEKENINYETKA